MISRVFTQNLTRAQSRTTVVLVGSLVTAPQHQIHHSSQHGLVLATSTIQQQQQLLTTTNRPCIRFLSTNIINYNVNHQHQSNCNTQQQQQPSLKLQTLSDDTRTDLLASIDHVHRVWNDGSLSEAISLASDELHGIEQMLASKTNLDDSSVKFLIKMREKLTEFQADMYLMTNQYELAQKLYRHLLQSNKREFEEEMDANQKRFNRYQHMRKRVQIVLRLAECLRRLSQFDESVKLLLSEGEDLSEEEVALTICLRERLGWSYSQRASQLSASLLSLQQSSTHITTTTTGTVGHDHRVKRRQLTEDALSLLKQAIHHLNVAEALAKQHNILDNSLEFTRDDVSSIVDVLFSRGLCYKDMASLEPNDDADGESTKHYYELAIKDFTKAIELDPTYYSAYFNCADCQAKINKHSVAIGLYDQFMEHFQQYVTEERRRGNEDLRPEELYVEMRIKRALCAIKIQDFPMAQDDLKETVSLIQNILNDDQSRSGGINRNHLIRYQAIAHNKLGYCFYRRYRYHDAIEQNTLAIKLDPTFMEAFRDRCECYECLSFESEAAEDRRMVEFLKRRMAVNQ